MLKPEEFDYFIRGEPAAQKFIRPFIGADEFIKGKRRYCLWLGDIPLDEIEKLPLCWERVRAVENFRLSSKKADTRQKSKTLQLFAEIRQSATYYILVSRVSSERRQYIPIVFMNANVIAISDVEICRALRRSAHCRGSDEILQAIDDVISAVDNAAGL